MVKIDWHYYIDEYTTLKQFMNQIYPELYDNRIVGIYSTGGNYSSSDEKRNKVISTCGFNYIVFDSNKVLKFQYDSFSIMDIYFTSMDCLSDEDKKVVNDKANLLELDCYDSKLFGYEIEKFDDEYIIEPTEDTIRPAGGDYFKEIVLYLWNNKKLCICPQNAETDGYCDIWIENNDERHIFNGENHKSWIEDNEYKLISYFDLITLMKYNKHPKKIKLYCEDGNGIFEFNEEYNCYHTIEDNLTNQNGMDSYFDNNIYEDTAFDKCIEILDSTCGDFKLAKYDYNKDMLSYYDILLLMKNNIFPKKLLVHCEEYSAHYVYDTDEKKYSVIFDELYDGQELGLVWDSCLNHELTRRMFDNCIEIVEE